ncbi:MAG: outer membrane beta-barrel protein, partial [Sediminibacterium sp.]
MNPGKLVLCLVVLLSTAGVAAQKASIIVKVSDEKQLPIEGAVVELLEQGKKIRAVISKKNGEALFDQTAAGTYEISASFTGFETQLSKQVKLSGSDVYIDLTLKSSVSELAQVTVQSSKPFIQREQGKLVVNPEVSPTNNGTTVVELLEKSPGVMIDRNNGISLRNKSGVLVLIDDKPTYLQGADLISLLSSMNTSQVEKIELITSPSAKYDAAGNSGIINIKTKKIKQIGFNGTLTMAAAMGMRPRTNNSLLLNYRKNKWSHYFSYGINYAKTRMPIYALRTYFDAARTPIAILEQPTFFNNTNLNNTIKYGTEFAATDKLTFIFSFSGSLINRKSRNTATADWLSPSRTIDSSIYTASNSENRFTTGAISIGSRHKLSKTQQLTIDADAARYDLNNEQYFQSERPGAQGYTIGTLGNIPSFIKIFSANSNYTQEIGRDGKLEAGVKTSKIDTDNDAGYAISINNGLWRPDYAKSNHFVYGEKIHAAYGMYEQKFKKLTVQAGLRYEYTHYDAHQLGNVVVKDSSFSRNYDGFFPSGFVTWEADTIHTFSLSIGRRIDRPNFQRLNPFVNIINKYTLERGNPFFRPQFTWNFELSHQYKQLLHTTFSYSLIKDYFSQLFLTDPD